ncbi:MAG: putative RNA methyltransferase, partial [Faecalibacterium sp.]
MGTAAFAPWRCPLCGAPLAGDVTLKCPSGHCFDRAKEGYWHLLPVQNTRTKAPGDSKEMVAARRAFLSAGYYGIFGQALGELCLEYGIPAAQEAPLRLLDAGCGEGWYDRCITRQFAAAARPLELAGFDIAKPAVRLAAKALPTARYAVASSFHQPVKTGWADLLLNCFSPFAREEFLRVL